MLCVVRTPKVFQRKYNPLKNESALSGLFFLFYAGSCACTCPFACRKQLTRKGESFSGEAARCQRSRKLTKLLVVAGNRCFDPMFQTGIGTFE